MNRPVNRGRKKYSFGRIPCYDRDRFRELKCREERLGGQFPDFDRVVERRRQNPIRRKNTKRAHDVRDGQGVVRESAMWGHEFTLEVVVNEPMRE